MPFNVQPMYALMSPDLDYAQQCDALAAALNEFEENGWELVKIVDQFREWPDTDELINTGNLTGPFVIFHQPPEKTARLVN